MTQPISITFPGLQPSPWIEADIRARAAKLVACCPELLTCHIVADLPHRRHRRGNRFCLRIDLTVPGEEIAVTRDATLHSAVKDAQEGVWAKRFDVEATRKDLGLVIKESFDVARRRLREYTRRRSTVKRQRGRLMAAA